MLMGSSESDLRRMIGMVREWGAGVDDRSIPAKSGVLGVSLMIMAPLPLMRLEVTPC